MSLLTRAPDEVLARLAQEALAALLDRHLNDRMLFRNAPALADVRNAISKFSKGRYLFIIRISSLQDFSFVYFFIK